ncbi:MAG: serine/threonine protein kinase [Bryobacterales bacterium]|nr:serine/threonine protein kinase [Bryobacterales bacterium]
MGAPPRSGPMLGPYRIISKIGEGGMGSVWLGVRADEQFDKKVAIKVAPRALENEEVRIRFRLERQTLARLDHPNIVKLLDGGASESGIPYLVMDHVEGAPLDRYADEQKLSIEQRLALFRKICAAVHYAHQHLVVHRDLKPGNILVTPDGEPKLLDFGIAKMLDTDSARFQVTSEGVVPMTLRYGSPEQIRGKAVSAGSDIYALGVLLYELLTGHTPHYKPGVPAETLMYMILNDDPRPPGAAVRQALDWPAGRIEAAALAEARSSTPERLSNQLAGDIDAIVLKALRKEPVDRYLSVEHFSEDIRRHLESLPVLALQGTWKYRARKFVNRHKMSVATAAVFSLALLGAMGGMVFQWNVARLERARAGVLFRDVHELARTFLFDFEASLEKIPGSTEARLMLVKRTSDYLERLTRDALEDESVLLDVGEAYIKLGSIQASPFTSSIGDVKAAEASYRRAVQIQERLLRMKPNHRQGLDVMARAKLELSEILGAMGRIHEAVAEAKAAAEIFASITSRDPHDMRAMRDAGVAYLYLAGVQGAPNRLNLGDRKGAIRYAKESIADNEKIGRMDPNGKAGLANLPLARLMLAYMLSVDGASRQARVIVLDLDRFAAGLRKQPADRIRSLLADIDDGIGWVWQRLDDHRRALDYFRESEDFRDVMARQDPNDTNAQSALAAAMYNRGVSYAALGDMAHGREHIGHSIEIWRRLVKQDPNNLLWQGGLADSLIAAGRAGEAMEISGRLATRVEATPDEIVRYVKLLREKDPQRAYALARRAVELSNQATWDIEDEYAQTAAAVGDWQRAIEAEGRSIQLLESYEADADFSGYRDVRERLDRYRQEVVKASLPRSR